MSGGFDDGRDADLEAAEYVLGTLDRDERMAFADRLRHDTVAAAAVAAWETRFAGLAGRIDAMAPPPYVWERLERAVSGGSGGAATIPFKVIPGGGRQATDTNTLRRSRNRWRTGALMSGAAAALLLIALADRSIRTPPPSEEPGATYVAAVNRGGDKPALIVRVDMKTGQVMVRPVAATAPEGRSLELWYIGTDKTPRSMGVVDQDPMHWTMPAGATGTATFAISVEPKGGSKTGAPTGPVVYSGQLVKE